MKANQGLQARSFVGKYFQRRSGLTEEATSILFTVREGGLCTGLILHYMF